MLAQLELSLGDLAKLADFARARNVLPIVTIFSREHVAKVRKFDWAAYKIASPDIIHRPLMEAVGKLGKPVILSTGAATIEEVQTAASWLAGHEFALMQCVSAYPTPTDSAHLAVIATLRDVVRAPVGYSDHTMDEHTGGLAVAAGATLLEKHITYRQSADGPDHAMSLEPKQFERYVNFARHALQTLGEAQKIVHDIEMNVRQVSRQSIVAARKLRAGQIVQTEDLAIKRPGTGIPPSCLSKLIGRKLARDVELDTALTEAHLIADPDKKRPVRPPQTAEVY